MKNNNNEFEWSIITSQNGDKCSACGKQTEGFILGTCWYSTFGLFQYGHPEFEIVIQQLQMELSVKILSALGILVESGQMFQEGAKVNFKGIDKEFHLKEFYLDGQKFLRLIIPDDNGRYPDDEGCAYPFSLQLKSIDELCNHSECNCSRDAVGDVQDKIRRAGNESK